MNKLEAHNLHKHFRLGGQDLHVLRGVDLQLADGEFCAIRGRSGSGKSTLLHVLGGLERPDSGGVQFSGQNIFDLEGGFLDRYRSRHVGFVFQSYHLLPELTALENVLIGAMIGSSMVAWSEAKQAATQRAGGLLDRVGLADRLRHRPGKLSGGERQRVAIARALINQPDVLLADEPTGNLDSDTSQSIMELFSQLHAEGQTIVLVTHDQTVASTADRSLLLTEGLIDTAGGC
jgi:ABC-type lipoprotein export system ATPase subunit